MSLQFEDVVDCVQILYAKYDFIFLFDHSQCHTRKRSGALSAAHMSRTYGGAIMLQEDGYLGTHLTRLLNVGDTQSMIFTPQDSGPWYLSFQHRKAHRKDRATGKSRRVERSKKLLDKALSEAGEDTTEKDDTQEKSCKCLLGFMALTLLRKSRE
jgi:hypothetical protein